MNHLTPTTQFNSIDEPATIHVELTGAKHSVASGTRILDLIDPQEVAGSRWLAAHLNHHLVALDTPLAADAHIDLVSQDDERGAAVLKRSIAHMLHTVFMERFPDITFIVGQSLLGGYYYEVYKRGGEKPDDLEALAASLTEGLQDLAAQKIPFQKTNLHVPDAQKHLKDTGGAKAKLLATWPNMLVPLVKLGQFTDMPHGPYAPHTGVGAQARVIAYPPGLVLQFEASEITAARKVTRLWACYRETRDWNRLVKIPSVGHLNEAILHDRIGDAIRVAEALHERKIVEIVEDLTGREKPIRAVFIAGPSSAGKSTFIRRLSTQLQVRGVEPVLVGLDNYYRNRADCPRDENGELDFEALEALDVPLINQQMNALLNGEAVVQPRFDFGTGTSYFPDEPPGQLGPNQILLVEGIHGLHPKLTHALPADAIYKVFINALTQLVIDAHNRIFTADARLLRRIVRDRKYRKTRAAETIQRWNSVRRGERKYIFPHQEEADVMFNSSLVYEPAVLKTYATRFLMEVPRNHPSRPEAHRLLGFLDLFVPVLPDEVPGNSVLREFIGGSHLSY